MDAREIELPELDMLGAAYDPPHWFYCLECGNEFPDADMDGPECPECGSDDYEDLEDWK